MKQNGLFFPLDLMDRPLVWFEPMGQMMIQLELQFAVSLDAERLARAVRLTMECEPVLRCRLDKHWLRPGWRIVDVDERDLLIKANCQEDLDAFRRAEIDTCRGPQLQVCLWNQAKHGAVLLVKVAHHVTDAAGLRDVVGILSLCYTTLGRNHAYQPPTHLRRQRTSNENIAGQLLAAVPRGQMRALKRQFQAHMKNVACKPDTFRLPFVGTRQETPFFLSTTIPEEQVAQLSRYGRKRAATLHDILISGFLRAQVRIGEWDGRQQLRLSTTIDMRRYLPGRKKSAAAGNCSLSLGAWPDLGSKLGESFADTLKRVSAVTRKGKENCLGLDTFVYVWPILRYMPHGLANLLVRWQMRKDREQGRFTDSLTNMGNIRPEQVFFDSEPVSAFLLAPPFYPPYLVVGASGYKGTLTLSLGSYSVEKELCTLFLNAMVEEMLSCSRTVQ